jgi:hypothetical protein
MESAAMVSHVQVRALEDAVLITTGAVTTLTTVHWRMDADQNGVLAELDRCASI